MTVDLQATGSLDVLERRPPPGRPRRYRFPRFVRHKLDNGLTVIVANLPGRPLLAANLLLEGGAATEPADRSGVTALAARGLSEGTEERDAIQLVEAAERLGTEIHADAGWEGVAVSLEVPRSRFGAALALLAETALRPSFPAHEIERLRDERLNDLLQARADPRRRAERAFAETIYAPASPYHRPPGGLEDTVGRLDRQAVVDRHAQLLDPTAATLIVAGDIGTIPVVDIAREHFGAWKRTARSAGGDVDASAPPGGGRLVIVDRPASPQSEVRVGHVGLRRRIRDYHAVAVMQTILGGLFNSRLQRLLREERGYTYGIGAGFEFRRSKGPFAVRTAVETDVTAPAVREILRELGRMRDAEVAAVELDEARDYLVGVFPLRFDTSGQVAAAIAGLVIHGLPDDELDRYRPAVAAVNAKQVRDAAVTHIRPGDLSVVVVGDAARVERGLRELGLPTSVVTDPVASGAEG